MRVRPAQRAVVGIGTARCQQLLCHHPTVERRRGRTRARL